MFCVRNDEIFTSHQPVISGILDPRSPEQRSLPLIWRLRIGIIPGSVFIGVAILFKSFAAGQSLSRTGSFMIAFLEEFLVDRSCRAIKVVFHYNGFITFGENFSVPKCFHFINFMVSELPAILQSVQ